MQINSTEYIIPNFGEIINNENEKKEEWSQKN